MNDIVPELLEAIENDYETFFNRSKKITALAKKLETGKAGYTDAYTYAVEVGNIRAKTFKKNISSSKLPDGKMYYNIAERLINTTLPVDQKMVSKFAAEVQNIYNKKNKIGLKTQTAKLDQSRLDGIIEKLVSGEQYDDVAWILDEPVKTFTQGVVDDTVKTNAKFQDSAGLEVTVVRIAEGGCCKWCDDLAGEYEYSEVAGKSDVFARHDNCRCMVEYNSKRLGANGHSYK